MRRQFRRTFKTVWIVSGLFAVMIRKSIVETSHYLTGNRPKVITGNRLLFLIVKCGSRAFVSSITQVRLLGWLEDFCRIILDLT